MGLLSAIEAFFQAAPDPEQKAKYLDDKVKTTGQKLDWRRSVVDLLKLMGQPSSLADRATLAKELGYDGAFTGTAAQNLWLHKKLMDNLRIA